MNFEINPFALFTTTAPNQEIAHKLAGALIQARLGACAQIFRINSTYIWKNQLENEDEWMVQLKTRSEHLTEIKKLVDRIHPYDVPECIATPIFWTSVAYGKWMDENTKS